MPASSTHRGAAMEARCSPKCVGGVGGGVDCGAWGWRWRRGEARREDETRNRHVCERLNHTKKKKKRFGGAHVPAGPAHGLRAAFATDSMRPCLSDWWGGGRRGLGWVPHGGDREGGDGAGGGCEWGPVVSGVCG